MRHHWGAVTAITVISTLIALAVGFLLPQRWEATAIMSLQPVAVTTGSSDINMETERVVASSASVANLAAESLDGVDASTLRDALEVRVPRGSQALEFVVVLGDPEQAAAAANAIAGAYGQLRVANAQRAVDAAVAKLVEQISALEQLAATAGQESVEGRAAIIQADALRETLTSFNRTAFGPGTIVSEATPPQEPTKPSLYVFIAAGFAFGLIVGALVAQYLARRQKAREDYLEANFVDSFRQTDSQFPSRTPR